MTKNEYILLQKKKKKRKYKNKNELKNITTILLKKTPDVAPTALHKLLEGLLY